MRRLMRRLMRKLTKLKSQPTFLSLLYKSPLWMAMLALLGSVAVPAMGYAQSNRKEPQGIPTGSPEKDDYRRSRYTRDETESTADRRSITVAVGEQRAVEIDFDPFNEEEVRIANPELLRRTIVTLRGGRQQLVLTGLKAGDTNVSIRNKEGQIQLILQVKVTGANLEKLAEEMRELLKDVDGLEIKVVGSKIVVEGELLTPVDYGRISAVMSDENYRPHLMNLVQMSPIALKILGDRIAQEILKRAKEQNLLDQEHPDKQEKGTDWSIRATVVNGLVEIGGEVPAPMMPPLPGAPARDITTLCESIAESFLPPIIPVSLLDRAENTLKKNDAKRKMHRCAIAQIQPVMKNLQPITPQPMGPQPPMGPTQQIRYRVHYVLLSKDYNKVYGFKWEPSFTTDPQISIGGNAQGGPNFAGTLASLIPSLRAAQDAGFARVLRESQVIGQRGGAVVVDDKTTIPFTVIGQDGKTSASQAANVGTKLEILNKDQPAGMGGNLEEIWLDVKIDHNTMEGRVRGGAPVVSSRSVKTEIRLKPGFSAAIVGLSSSDVGTDFNKDDPRVATHGANTEPVFSMVHSKSYRKKRSQYVVFITPELIVDPHSHPFTQDLKKNFRVKLR